MVEFKRVDENLSRSAQAEQFNNNDTILEGRISEQEFADQELNQIYTDLVLDKKYQRKIEIGHTTTNYSSWTHYRAEAGYSIWNYPVTDFRDGLTNLLFLDHVKFDYKGEASSLAMSSFTKVLNVYDGICYDHTVEAASEGGTAFSFLQVADGSTCWILLCGSTTFKSIDFDLETVGGNYSTKLSYWNGADWGLWDGTCSGAGFIDNTSNFHYNGRIEYNLPTDWVEYQIDGTSGYWVKVYTTDAPSQVAKAYYIMPGSSVPTLLSLSEYQVLNQDYAWCYYSNNIYITLPNNGNAYYEGDYYIKSSSSTENLQAYFITNHTVKISYEKDTYTPLGALTAGRLSSLTKNQTLQLTGTYVGEVKYINDIAPADGMCGAIALWTGTSWVATYISNFLIDM